MGIIKIKKVIHCFNILKLLVLCVSFTACRTVRQPVNTPIQIGVRQDRIEVSVPIDEIPILAWWGVQEHTIERYKELRECNIDYNFSVNNNVEELAQALDAANEAGIKLIIYCPEQFSQTEMVVNRFKNHPALAGYFIRDEPLRDEFQYLGDFIRRIQLVDNEHFCYVNLGPNWGTETECRSHIQLFLQHIPAALLSYDNYPIRVVNGKRTLIGWWWLSQKVFQEEAQTAGIPWWGFALTTSHEVMDSGILKVYPTPTLADLRLQVYSNLAYGAQGIQYYTYWSTDEVFRDAPIDYFTHQKTAVWYAVQQMGKEIKALSKVFLGAQVIKVEHIVTDSSGGDGYLPHPSTTRFDFSDRPKEANIIKKFIIPNNTNAVVSFLKNGKRCYMVVINRNLEGGDDVTFTITGGKGLQLIQKDGTVVDASKTGSMQTVTPGDALIYGWDL